MSEPRLAPFQGLLSGRVFEAPLFLSEQENRPAAAERGSNSAKAGKIFLISLLAEGARKGPGGGETKRVAESQRPCR